MRIIAGSARSRVIKAPEGLDTRPTLDRVRESLFNILQRQIPGASVLDLFGGSGALGLEAVSRGAAHAVICDRSPKAVRIIRENVETLRFGSQVTVMPGDWRDCVAAMRRQERRFRLIFLDPPYEMTDLVDLTDRLLSPLAEDGLVILEHEQHRDPQVTGSLNLVDLRRYGIAGIRIYAPRKEE